MGSSSPLKGKPAKLCEKAFSQDSESESQQSAFQTSNPRVLLFYISYGRRSYSSLCLLLSQAAMHQCPAEVFGLQRQQGSALKSITSLAPLHELYSPLPKILNPGQVEMEAGRSNKSLTLKTTNWF